MKLLSVDAFAGSVGVSRNTVLQWIKAGKVAIFPDETRTLIPVYTTKEFSDELGISRSAVVNRVKNGSLPGVRSGRGYLLWYRGETGERVPGTVITVLPGIHSTREFSRENLRINKMYAFKEDAINYAKKIPIPTLVAQQRDGFWFVAILGGS